MAWIAHVKDYQKRHPGMSYGEAMRQGRASYSGPGRLKKAPKPKKGKGPVDFVQNLGARLTERPGDPPKNRLYPGEKHGLIWNADFQRYEPAQFLGPGTNVAARTAANQQGLAPVDRVAKAHDLRYSIGTTKADIKAADDIFYSKVADLRQNEQDVPWNLNQASLLRIKDYLPFLGSSPGGADLDPALKMRYENQLAQLAREGYGSRSPWVWGHSFEVLQALEDPVLHVLSGVLRNGVAEGAAKDGEVTDKFYGQSKGPCN